MTRRLTTTLLSLLLLTTLGACGGSEFSGSPEVPAGFKPVREQWVSFSVPQAWRVAREPSRNGVTVRATAPEGGDEAAFASVLVLKPGGDDVDNQLELRENAEGDLPDAKLEEPEEVDIDGATRAVRYRTTYASPAGGGPAQTIAVFADREDESTAYFRVSALDRDDVDLQSIARSLRLQAP